MLYHFWLFLTYLGSRITFSTAIIGYDCSQQVSNLTTFSLINVGECDIPEPVVNSTRIYIRLLQLNEFATTRVRVCKVEIKRVVTNCAFWADKDIQEVKYIAEVTWEECKTMHERRTYKIKGKEISNLQLNGTKIVTMDFVGYTDLDDGDCHKTGYYEDPFGKFEDVVVTGYVTITLKDYYAPVNLNANEVILQSGTRCPLNKDNCNDVELGYSYWEPLPKTTCDQGKYSELYSGEVNKIIEQGNEKHPVYIVESEEVTFAFTSTGLTIPICNYDLIRTEHPKLFILEGPNSHLFSQITRPSIHDLDIFAYVNSKFIYVEKHIKAQVKRLYYDLILQKCELERRVIQNALGIAATSPDVFAYQITKKKGYMGLVAGEVVHLMKCIQVDVKRRQTNRCYQELPVYREEKEMFLSPRTHILKQYGSEATCNPLIPPMFLLGESWFTILPKGTTRGINPTILKPQTKFNWSYTDPIELANSGIYTPSEIQALKQHLMFPVERPAMLNSIALGMSGMGGERNGMSIARLFDEEALTQLANSTWKRLWGQFMTLGSFSAGVIAIVMIFRTIKFFIDTILHGYALYTIYGWSIKIIGAVWNSVTQLLLHAARDKPTRKQQKEQRREEINNQQQILLVQPSAPPNTPLYGNHTIIRIEENRNNSVGCQVTENKLYPVLFKEPDIPSLPPRNNKKSDNV